MGIALGDVLMSRYPRPRRFGYHNNCGGEGMFQAPCGAWDCEDCNPDTIDDDDDDDDDM